MLWPKLQSGIFYELWFLMILAVKRAHTARAPQPLADLGQIKAEILPNTCERLPEPAEGASWVAFGRLGAARQAQSITEKSIFHKSSECYFDSGRVGCGQRTNGMQASAVLLYFLPF